MKRVHHRLIAVALCAALSTFLPLAVAQTAGDLSVSESDLLKREIQAGQRVLESARARLVSMLSQVDQLTETQAGNGSSNNLSREELLALSTDIEASRDELARTQRQIERIQTIRSAKQRELDSLSEQARVVEAKKQEQIDRLAMTEKEVETSRSRLVELDGAMQLSSLEVRDLSDVLINLEAELEATRKDITMAQLKKSAIDAQVDTRELSLEEVKANEEQVRAVHELRQTQLAEEKARLKSLLDSLNSNDKEQGGLKNSSAALQSELVELEAATQFNSAELVKTSQQLTRAQRLLDSKQVQLATMKKQYDQLELAKQSKADEITTTASEVEQRQLRKEQIEGELELRTKEISDLQKKVTSREAELGEAIAASNNVAALRQNEDNKLTELRRSLNAVRENSARLKESLDTLDTRVAQEKASLEATKLEVLSVRKQNEDLQAALASETEEAIIDQEKPRVLAELKAIQTQLKEQEALLVAEKRALEATIQESAVRQTKLAELEQSNFEIWEEIGWNKLRIEQSEKELIRERKKVTKAKERFSKLESDLKGEQEVAARLKTQHDAQLKRQAEIKSEMDMLQSTVNFTDERG